MADEYIKREDALKAMEWKWAGKSAIEAVKAIPATNVVEVKHGKWYTKSMTRRGGHGEAYFVYGCSLCKKKIRYKTDYCPNCGARMDGE